MDLSFSIVANGKKRWEQIMMHPHWLSILFLGFASGLPLALTGSTLQAWYSVSGVHIVMIGALSLVGQPYVYKFLWAPLFDRYSLPWLGRRLGWVFLTQCFLTLALFLMGMLEPSREPLTLAILALAVSFLSASQDIGIDAYRTELLQPKERGLGAALNTVGYRIALLVASAGALVMADYIGWRYTYWAMALLMSFQLFVTYHSEEPKSEISQREVHFWQHISEPLRDFLKRPSALRILLFIMLYKLGDVFTLLLSTVFLLREVGFSLTDIGLLYKIIGMIGIFAGTLLGGILMRRLSLLRALVYFGVIQAFTNLPYLLLAIYGKHYSLLISAVFIENFGSGLGSVAFLAFIMSLCNHRYTATQFALFSAIASVGRVFVGPLAGVMVAHLGWIQYYLWAFLAGFPAILILRGLRREAIFTSHTTELSAFS